MRQQPFVFLGPLLPRGNPGWLDSNVLDGTIMLPLLRRGFTFTIDQDKTEELVDGTILTTSEVITLEVESLRITKAFLDSIMPYQNQLIDIVLVDIWAPYRFGHKSMPILRAWKLRLSISILAESDSSAIIRMKATRSFSSDAPLDPPVQPQIYLETLNFSKPSIIHGTITGEDGSPVPGALVVFEGTDNSTAVSNRDGFYACLLSADDDYGVKVHADGLSFSELSLPCKDIEFTAYQCDFKATEK